MRSPNRSYRPPVSIITTGTPAADEPPAEPVPDVVGYLLPTKTRKKRGYSMVRCSRPGEGDWRVAIIQDDEAQRYYLEEGDCIGFAGRRFLWVKCEDGETYETHIGADFVARSCTCTAGRVGRDMCKHVEVLFDATFRKLIPPMGERT